MNTRDLLTEIEALETQNTRLSNRARELETQFVLARTEIDRQKRLCSAGGKPVLSERDRAS